MDDGVLEASFVGPATAAADVSMLMTARMDKIVERDHNIAVHKELLANVHVESLDTT